jgi:hypothetical protein
VANSTERGYDIGKEIRWLGKHGQICESGLHTLPFGRRYRDHFVQHISGDARMRASASLKYRRGGLMNPGGR